MLSTYNVYPWDIDLSATFISETFTIFLFSQRFEKFTRGIDRNVQRAQALTRRYNQLMMKDIQENMNNLYDGPFNSGHKSGQRTQGVGNAQQGMLR